MRFGVRTDKGIIRGINEDSYNVISGYSAIPLCFILADGMGGHNSGEVASKMAVDFISSYILEFPESLAGDDIQNAIQDIINKANVNVYHKSQENESNHGMGTTLILAVVVNKKMFIGHIGDSRVYLVRDGIMERVTTDHSYIEELVRSGSLTREQAENHPQKNIITRALGCSEEVQVDTYFLDIKDKDVFVLCTDGLTNMVFESEIQATAENIDDPEKACNVMIETANKNGGEDNITVMVLKND